MPFPRLRRTPPMRPDVLLRTLSVLLASALLLTACGGTKDKAPESGKAPSKAGSSASAKPGDDAPAPDPGFGIAKVGQCYRLTPAQSRASVAGGAPVACRTQHDAVVAYVGYLPKAVTPATPLAQRKALGQRVCEPAYRKLAGGTLADRATSILTWTLFTPGQAQLQRGARWVRCDVVARSGSQLVPLPATQPLLGSGVPEQLRVCQNAAGIDISCARPHAFRVEAVYQAAGNAYPAAPAYTPTARARCQELTKKFGGYWQPPSRAGWQSGDRFVRCLSNQATAPVG
jgi:hypothetical protein